MLARLRYFLGTHVDNSPLILFRILFGLLLAAECIGAIFTGWVKETMVDPKFTFTVIGLEWLQPLEGNGMYVYFAAMGLLGVMISLGLFYRASVFAFTALWTVVYLMQKSHYNNHYYLLILLGVLMLLLPAHKAKSLDARWGLTTPAEVCPRICHWVFISQILIVYVYASIHKMNPDWMIGKPLDLWFQNKKHYWLIGPLLAKDWMPLLIAWGGIIYDGSIGFLLLFRRTRKAGFLLSIVFNLFNSAVFQIGIFPYLMILLSVFFFPPETIRRLFFKRKKLVTDVPKSLSKGWLALAMLYFGVQLLLPLRHHFFSGNPNWTEEGHRLAWRMMLRVKSGSTTFEVVDKKTGEREVVLLRDYLSSHQISAMKGKPDMMWQFAQHLKKANIKEGRSVAVYATSFISLNGHPKREFIDSEVNLADVKWEHFAHADWIKPYE